MTNKDVGGVKDTHMVENSQERDQLIRAAENIRRATNRADGYTSDGGSSGKSDTNDLQQD